MSKQKSYTVQPATKKDAFSPMSISSQQMHQMRKAADRQSRIESGAIGISGTGVHGGDKLQRRKRERENQKNIVRLAQRGIFPTD